jgi:hypothetical protein
LTKTIRAYAENDFPATPGSGSLTSTEQINTFIQQAERRVYNSVQLLELRKNVTGTTTTNNRYLTVPIDWLANFSLATIDPVTGAYDYLINKDVSYIREAFPVPATSGKPTHYAMFDQTSYLLGPTPDAAYPMELHYFYYPESIVTASTSWLGDNFEPVLLYGSLIEAYTFMKGEADILAQYQQRYDTAFGMLKQLAEGKNRQDMYRTQQIILPVT